MIVISDSISVNVSELYIVFPHPSPLNRKKNPTDYPDAKVRVFVPDSFPFFELRILQVLFI